MSAKAQPAPLFKAFDRNGKPLNGGMVHTYKAGESTPLATFQDAAGSALHSNPIVLDAAGEAAVFWGTGPYRVMVEDASGVFQWEVDGFDPQVADVPAPAVNLIANGSFEADTDADGVPDGWTFTPYPGGSVDVDRYNADTNPTPDTRHGAAALRMVSPGGAGNGGGYAETADFFEVGEGQALDVAFALKSTAAGAHLKVELLWYGANQGLASTTTLYDEQATNPAAWTDVLAKTGVPTGTRFAKLRLYGGVDDNPTAATARFDHVTVQAVQPQYLRSDEADTMAGVLTFTATPVLANNISLIAKDTGGGSRALAILTSGDAVYLADPALPTLIRGTSLTFGASASTVWHSGNDGAGSGLDADTLDGVQGANYARKDAAAGDQSFDTLNLVVSNQKALLGQETGGTPRNIANVSGSNEVILGDGNVVTRIRGSALTFGATDETVWHAGNDGAGSGLDADTLDGQQAAAFAAAGHGHTGFQGSAVSTVDVTVDAVGVVVLSLDVGTVQAGQYVVVTGRHALSKGAVAGVGTLGIDQGSGTAQIVDLTGVSFLNVYSYVPANQDHRFYSTGVFRVTTGGTLVVRLSAASVGSDSTIFAGEALLGALVLTL
jgi:hypothetical protein